MHQIETKSCKIEEQILAEAAIGEETSMLLQTYLSDDVPAMVRMLDTQKQITEEQHQLIK